IGYDAGGGFDLNFEIRYRTEYRYQVPVSENLNVLRVKPQSTEVQRCEEFAVKVSTEARLSRYSDYFGTEVIEFGVAEPHDRLSIDAFARVSTDEPAAPVPGDWKAGEGTEYRAAGGEFLLRVERPDPADVVAGL